MTDTEATQDPYTAIADLYVHVVPYRERQDVPFFVSARVNSTSRFWRSAAAPVVY